MRPIICLISDRRRDGVDWEMQLLARVRAAAQAGIDLVQIREWGLDGRAMIELVGGCLTAVASTRTRVIVNDRIDVALCTEAHGIHLQGNGPNAQRIRAIAPKDFLIGRSVHSVAEARFAAAGGGLDYLTFGTVYTTISKPNRTPAGSVALEEAAASVELPMLAVGGITLERIPAVVQAGAAGVAGIGLFAERRTDNLKGTVVAIQRLFDTHETVP